MRHAASLVARLRTLATDSPVAVRAAQEARSVSAAAAFRTFEDTVSRATERFLDRARATEHSAAVKRKALLRDLEAAVALAEKARHKAVRAFDQATRELADKSAKELEEGEWLSDTLVEAGDRKADLEVSTARTTLGARRKQLEEAGERAAQVLTRAGYRNLPGWGAPPLAADVSESETPNPEDAYALTAGLIDRTRILADSPSGSRVLVGIATIAAAFAAAAWLALEKRPIPEIGKWAGIAAIGTFALLLAVQTAFRARVPRSAAKAARSVASFQAAAARRLSEVEASAEASRFKLRDKRDREVVKLKAVFESARAAVARRESIEGPALAAEHQQLLQAASDRRDTEIAAHDSETQARLAGLRQERESTGQRAAVLRDEALLADDRADAAVLRTIAENWASFAADWQSGSQRLGAETARSAPTWESMKGPGFQVADGVPQSVPFGHLHVSPLRMARQAGAGAEAAYVDHVPADATLPIALEFAGKGSLLVRHTARRRSDALRLLNQVMLRIITAVPPAKARFTIIDPVGLGQGFSAFMHLADAEPLLVSDKIWTEPRHIEQKLGDLTEHMENVIQKYLRNQFTTIAEYNEAAGEVAEPLRFLVIADFPSNLTDLAASRLTSVVSAGARCGVFTLIAADLAAKGLSQIPVLQIERTSIPITLSDGNTLDLDPFRGLDVRIDEPPAEEQFTELLGKVGAAAKEFGRVQVPFDTVAPPDDREWSSDASLELSIPIGRAGARKLQRLTLGRGTAQHALIAGRTGSGKSTLFHVIITNLALWYSTREVELYLVDFKKGVEFKAYAAHSLPHARVIAVESEREFGISVLRRLDAELTRRGVLFRDAGAQDVAAYRAAAAISGGRLPDLMPRIVLAVDEFQEFFVDDDRIAQDAALLLDRLVRQGRAFGIHLILGSQTLGGAFSIARSTIGQMGVRIALQSSEQDSYLIMSEDNTAPRLLTRPGEAIYNDASGLVEGNSPFQVVWLPDGRRDSALDRTNALADQSGDRPPPPIVFEGNLPADVRNNAALALLAGGRKTSKAPIVWFGEAISIKDPTHAVFHRRGGANALFTGTDEAAMSAMFAVAIVTLLSQTGPGTVAAVTVVNGMSAEGESGIVLDAAVNAAGHADASASPGSAGRANVTRHGPREAAAAVGVLASEVARRLTLLPEEAEGEPPRFLLLYGVQRIRDLRRADDFSFSATETQSPADQLAMILREGPNVGVHVLLWCDTVNALERVVNRQSMREFGWRIVTQMSGNDSTHVIDTPSASSLGRNRALLFSDETAGLEKFRPYSPPSSGWLRHAVGVTPDRTPAPEGVVENHLYP